MKKIIITLILIFSVIANSFGQNPTEPKIGTLDGNQFICVKNGKPQIDVRIEIPVGYSKSIDHFVVEWFVIGGGGVQSITIPGSYNPPNQKLLFDLGSFYGSCTYEIKGDITVYTYIKGESEAVNNGFKPTFRQPPVAKFNLKSNVCVGESLILDGSPSCPSGKITKYSWKIDGKEVSNLISFNYIFSKAGNYSIKLEVENECGKHELSKTITVFDKPIAVAEVDSGAVKSNNLYRVCLDSKNEAFVKLDGSKSSNGNRYEWMFISSGSGTFNYGKDKEKSKIKFTQTGNYTIVLKVSQPCEIPDYDTLTFIVSKADVISLNEVQASCNPIRYTPSPYFSTAAYYINGNKVVNFPAQLGYGKHQVIGVLNNECGETRDTIEFSIVQATDTKIISPLNDTTVCKNSNPVPIKVNVPNGTFNSTLVQYNPVSKEYFFHPTTEGKHTIKYSTGVNECERSDEIAITVLPGLNLSLQPQSDVCLPYNYTPSPLITGAEYFINGIKIQSFPYVITKGGEIKVEAKIKNDCEEKSEKISFNAIDAKELKIITDGKKEICVNSAPILLKSSIPGAVFSGPHLTLNNNEASFNPVSEGTFTIRLKLPIAGCQQEDAIEFKVSGISGQAQDISVCAGTKGVELTGNPLGGKWTSPTCPACISGSYFDLTKTNAKNITVIYTLSNDIGCTSESSALIRVLEAKSQFELSTTPCGSGINFNTNNSVGDSFKWLIDGKPAGTPPFNGLQNGTYNFSLIASIGACHDTSSKSIFIKSAPANPVDFSLPVSSHCTPYTLTPQVLSPYYNFLDYKWTIIKDGKTEQYNSFNIGNIELVNESPFKQTVKIIFSAENECGKIEKTDSIEIVGIPKSIIGIDSSRFGCSPYTIAISNIAQGEAENCTWRIDGKVIQSCEPYVYHTFIAKDSVTKFPIELEVSGECGRHIAYDTITVSPPWIDVFFNTDEYEVCPNTLVSFEDATTPAPVYWKWDFGNGKFSDEQNPSVEFSQPGTYHVILKASTGCGYDSITRPIIVKDVPNVDFVLPVYACQNQTSDTIINLSEYQKNQFVWDFGNGVKDSISANPAPVFEDFGVYPVTLTVTDKNTGCSHSLSKSYEIKGQPQINILLDSIICFGKELRIPNNTLYANDYTWYYDRVAVHKGKDPLIIFNETGEHYIHMVATYNDKCVDSISKVVFVRRCDVYIPNLFTPNNDGKDDFFTAFGGVNTSMIRSMKLFDRWGEMVFSKENFPLNVEYLGWDGSLNTRSKSYGLNSAVFVYLIEIEFTDGSREFFKGDVTLLR